MNPGTTQIQSNNLKVMSDQLNHECLLNKKYSLYSTYCTDPQLKSLCTQAAETHKQNFNELKSFFDSRNQ